MADNHTKEIRSKNMSHIRCKDTKPEIKVRSFLHRHGFRFRKNDKRYPGKPDIILPKYKTAIYVNGCFWHMHNCNRFRFPKSNINYWINKLNNNKKRDIQHYERIVITKEILTIKIADEIDIRAVNNEFLRTV